MLQQRWTNTYGPDATGEYADRSYWLCTENWPNQNYPKDLSVYNKMGGFSNGYVPMFIVVGFQNKVYYNDNYSNWESALNKAINEMVAEGVFVDNDFDDQIMLFNDSFNYNVSDVFIDLEGNPVTVTIESNSNPEIVSATIENNTLYVSAGSSFYGTSTITLRGTAGEFSATDVFNVTVYDSYYYNIESLESGTFNNSYWSFSGNNSWSIDNTVYYDGTYSAKSNAINHNQKAEMSIEAEYPTAGKISYRGKASSELGYDHLKFFIDGVEKKKISGQTAWLEASFDVNAGKHIFKWSYNKDGSSSSYSDCAWVDYITFLGGRTTGIESDVVPTETRLIGNYPNPFNNQTVIEWETDSDNLNNVSLSIYNTKGELVQNAAFDRINSGKHSHIFNADGLNSGMYYYNLSIDGEFISSKKMLYLK